MKGARPILIASSSPQARRRNKVARGIDLHLWENRILTVLIS